MRVAKGVEHLVELFVRDVVREVADIQFGAHVSLRCCGFVPSKKPSGGNKAAQAVEASTGAQAPNVAEPFSTTDLSFRSARLSLGSIFRKHYL